MSYTILIALCVVLAGVQPEGLAQIDQIQSPSAPSKTNASDSNGGSSQSSRPYSIIANRNIFGLSGPAPPAPPSPSDNALQATVKFTGFFGMPGEPTWAVFASIPKDRQGKATNFVLAEGEYNECLELVNVATDRKLARVIIAGKELTLALQDGHLAPPPPDTGPVPGPWLSGPQPRRFPP